MYTGYQSCYCSSPNLNPPSHKSMILGATTSSGWDCISALWILHMLHSLLSPWFPLPSSYCPYLYCNHFYHDVSWCSLNLEFSVATMNRKRRLHRVSDFPQATYTPKKDSDLRENGLHVFWSSNWCHTKWFRLKLSSASPVLASI